MLWKHPATEAGNVTACEPTVVVLLTWYLLSIVAEYTSGPYLASELQELGS